jgi:hypothetical protein
LFKSQQIFEISKEEMFENSKAQFANSFSRQNIHFIEERAYLYVTLRDAAAR